MKNNGLGFLLIAARLAATLPARLFAADAPSSSDPEQKLEQQIGQMQQQLEAMKQQLQSLKAQNEALATQQQQQAAQSQAAATAAPTGGGISPDLSLWGYGEIYYTHPIHDSRLTEFDLARAVFGFGYRLDDRTLFNSEYEVEHAVTSAADRGEFEVEQFFRMLADWTSVKAGLFLMPFGLLNEHHEPTNFYDVQRNFVETLIIPSTWREGGVGLHGTTSGGFGWDLGITIGLNLSGWNNNPEDPQYRTALDLEDNDVARCRRHIRSCSSPTRSTCPNTSRSGTPACRACSSAQPYSPASSPCPPSRVDCRGARHALGRACTLDSGGGGLLGCLRARHDLKHVDLQSGQHGSIQSLAVGVSRIFSAGRLFGVAAQGIPSDSFMRWEHYDLGASYEGIAPGFTTVPTGRAADGKPWPQPRDRVWIFGTNFYLNPHLVLKADYQQFSVNTDFTRFDLGLGLNY